MANVILTGVLLCILGGASLYIYKEKKRGVKCIGCPAAGACGSHCSGTAENSCSCSKE